MSHLGSRLRREWAKDDEAGIGDEAPLGWDEPCFRDPADELFASDPVDPEKLRKVWHDDDESYTVESLAEAQRRLEDEAA